jgi:MFS family permease
VLLVDSPLALVATALFATAANAPFRAAASAAVPNLVPDDRLQWANGAMATAFNASLVVGPLVGGALVGSVGPRSGFALNVVTFLISALVIARIPGSFAERTEAVADGPTARWRDVAASRGRRRLFTVTALSFGAFGVTLVADLPLVDHFGGGAVGYALLTTLWGLGAVAGSLVAGRLPERYERRSLIGGTAAMAVGLGSIAVMPGLAAAIAVGTIGGVGSGMAFTPWFSLLQRGTPDAQRGTAFAMAETFEQSSFIAGMVVAGVVVEPLGAQATYLLPGTLLLLATVVALRLAPEPSSTVTLTPAPVTG